MTQAVLESNTVLEQDYAAVDRVRAHLNETLKGKPEVVDDVLICLFAQGHLLIEDKPGLGKTTLSKALSTAIGGQFARLQCTPDLLPSDITGFNIFSQKTHEFEYRPGPVFSDVLLADEINRATPRTQSALLEAMAERQVTVDNERFQLPDQFFVIATQNPVEQHGTYPLPEAQLDRFAMKLSIGYPHQEDELRMLQAAIPNQDTPSKRSDETILANGQLQRMQNEVARVAVAEPIQQYLVEICSATRKHPRISLGVSPRGLLTWQRTVQAKAFLDHRTYVTPDDVQELAVPVLGVRLGVDDDDSTPVIKDILQQVPLPEYTNAANN